MTGADGLAALVPDGALLALPPDNSLAPCELARALVRRGARGLRLLGVPVSGCGDRPADRRRAASPACRPARSRWARPGSRRASPRGARRRHRGDRTRPARPSTPCCRRRRRACRSCRCAACSAATSWRTGRTGGDRQPVRGRATRSCCCRRCRPTSRPSTRCVPTATATSMSGAGGSWRRSPTPSRRVLVTVERIVAGNLLEDERMAPGTISGVYVERSRSPARRVADRAARRISRRPGPHCRVCARGAHRRGLPRPICDRHVTAGRGGATARSSRRNA